MSPDAAVSVDAPVADQSVSLDGAFAPDQGLALDTGSTPDTQSIAPDAPPDVAAQPDTAPPDTAIVKLDAPPDMLSPDTGPSPLCVASGARPALKRTLIVSGLAKPTEIAGPPDEPDVLWVIEHRIGRIRVIKNGAIAGTLLQVTVAARANDEEGLYSLAFHPDYVTNKLFYIFYSSNNDPDYSTTIDEFKKTGATTAQFQRNVYSRPSSHYYHNGGSIAFSPVDRSLYISVGDNSANCGPTCAQQLEGDFGRILRIDLTAKTGTTLHYGLRNPYRFSFDAQNGDLYIGDVGESGANTENVFYSKVGSSKTNFGWGTNTRPAALDQTNSGTPIIGGIVYRGTKMPGLCGYYVYGRHNGGPIKTLKVVNGQATNVADSAIYVNKLSSLGADATGELYYSEYADGDVYRIDPN